MTLKKTAFMMTVASIVGLYGLANATLYYMKGGFTYFEDGLFIIITSIFALMIIQIIPRTIYIMLGGESQPPETEINEINEKEMLDDGSKSQY